MSRNSFDLIIAGAGPVGCTAAREAAEQGWKVLLMDRRPHLAGNTHDFTHASGIRAQSYGPHYFRTDNASLIKHLSRFTEWVPGRYFVQSRLRGRYFPFPINLNTLELFFGKKLDSPKASKLLEGLRLPLEAPKNSEEFVLSRVGRELYEAFYKGYTYKQWGRTPAELDPSVCGRIPIRLNRDNRYVDQKYQVMPAGGFLKMFENMLSHPGIQVMLNADYLNLRRSFTPKIAALYCGALDEYFGFKLGRLPYRSMRFEFKEFRKEFYQPCVQVNDPSARPYIRSIEYKHLRLDPSVKSTLVSFEYPSASGEPYYPVPSPESLSLAERYRKLARLEEKRGVFFAGRLAEYRYINTDEAIETGLTIFRKILKSRPSQMFPRRGWDRKPVHAG